MENSGCGVVAIDPGKASGVVTYGPTTGISACTLDRPGVYTLLATLDANSVTVVVESYIISPSTMKKSRQQDALNIIGAIDFFRTHHSLPVFVQQPGSRVPERQLRERYPTVVDQVKDDHQWSALGHLVTHIARTSDPLSDDWFVLMDWLQ